MPMRVLLGSADSGVAVRVLAGDDRVVLDDGVLVAQTS